MEKPCVSIYLLTFENRYPINSNSGFEPLPCQTCWRKIPYPSSPSRRSARTSKTFTKWRSLYFSAQGIEKTFELYSPSFSSRKTRIM